MTEFVRVKDNDTGHEFSIAKRLAEGLKGDSISILENKDALDANGRPAPAKPNTRVLEPKTEKAPDAEPVTATGELEPKTESTGTDDGANTPPVSAEMTPPTAGTKPKAGGQK